MARIVYAKHDSYVQDNEWFHYRLFELKRLIQLNKAPIYDWIWTSSIEKRCYTQASNKYFFYVLRIFDLLVDRHTFLYLYLITDNNMQGLYGYRIDFCFLVRIFKGYLVSQSQLGFCDHWLLYLPINFVLIVIYSGFEPRRVLRNMKPCYKELRNDYV